MMRMMRHSEGDYMKFHFRPILTIFALASIAILLSLGTWQIERLAWKLELIEKIENRTAQAPQEFDLIYAGWSAGQDQEYVPVTLTGRFLHDQEVHVFGTHDGKPGWYVMTPLDRGTDKALVYINRGFVVMDKKDPEQRAAGQITGEVTLTGLFRAPAKIPFFAGLVQAKDNPQTNQWHHRDASVFAAAHGLQAASVIVDAGATDLAAPVEGPLGGTTELAFRNKHMEYALTWYGLAAALAAVFLVFSLSARDPRTKSERL